MSAPVTPQEAKLFCRIADDDPELAGLSDLIDAATEVVQHSTGLSLTSTSPAPLRLAILMLVLRAWKRGDTSMPTATIEAWIKPYRVEPVP